MLAEAGPPAPLDEKFLSACLSYADVGIVRRLMDTFLAALDARLDAIATAHDPASQADRLHQLAGAAGAVGAAELAKTCKTEEARLRTEATAGRSADISKVRAAAEQAATALRQYCKSLGAAD